MSSREFGNLLTQGLKSIAAREQRALTALQDELGHDMEGTTRWSIEKWRQGNGQPDVKKIAFLARAGVQRGGMDKQWLLHFLTQANFPDKEALVRELFPGEMLTVPSIRHNLPGRSYEQFIGRESELAEIEKFLSPLHRLGVICLSGIAGVGKTTLALESAHRCCENYPFLPVNERFEAIVWVTAKQTELLHIGPVPRNPTFTDLNSLYQAIAEVLDLQAITRAVTLADRDVIVARTLSEHRVLLVVDNLEDIDDRALMVFLRDLPTPSKAIVTTRHRIDLAVAIHLKALNENEARELIHIECRRRNFTLNDEHTDKLLKRTGYLPLAIVRTIGRMAWRGSSVEAELRQLGTFINDIQDFCFKKSIALIHGHDAHKLFMALSLFSTTATRNALGYIVGFGEDVYDRDEGLSDLEVLSLVNKEGDRFNLEPLTKMKAQAELTANPDFEHEARKLWIEWYGLLAQEIEKTTNYALYKAEINNLKSVIDWLIGIEQMDAAARFFQCTRRFFFAMGRWGALVRLAKQFAKWGESTDNTVLLADTLDSLTNVFRWQADQSQGKEWLERIQSSALRLSHELLQADVWLNRVRMLDHQPISSREEIDIATQALEVFRSYNKIERVVLTLNVLGNLHLRQGHAQDAMRYYQQGLGMLEDYEGSSTEVIQLHAALLGNLGHVAGFQHDFEKASDILRETLKKFTDQSDLAEAYASLAFYEYQTDNKEQAYQFRRLADRIIKQLNMIRPICPEDGEWMQQQAKG